MGSEDGGVFFSGSVVERLVEVTVNGGAVLAFELNVFGLDELELGHDGVVGLGEASELVARGGLRVNFAGAVGHVDLDGDVAILRYGIGVEGEAGGNRAGDFAACQGDAAEILCAIVIGDEVDRVPVGGHAR